MKGSRIETLEKAREGYKELLKVGGKLLFIIICRHNLDQRTSYQLPFELPFELPFLNLRQ
tara:strand:- start:203 stop:382 length:180 start_codon:yes stop_codon:yes gene_type:complete